MKKLFFMALIALVSFGLTAGDEPKKGCPPGCQATCPSKKAEKKVEKQTICGIGCESEKLESYTDYKGKRIYFCCDGCKDMFKKDPEKYVAMLKEKHIFLADAPKEEQ